MSDDILEPLDRLAMEWLADDGRTWVASCGDDLQDALHEVREEVVKLQRWKAEAMEVISGLQELGEALGVPLGERVTGPAAVKLAQALREAATGRAKAGNRCWCGGEVGPRIPGDENGIGCLLNINHDWHD